MVVNRRTKRNNNTRGRQAPLRKDTFLHIARNANFGKNKLTTRTAQIAKRVVITDDAKGGFGNAEEEEVRRQSLLIDG